MKIGAFQFAVSGDMKHNLQMIKKAVARAAQESVKLLVFPECALTGYPPRDMESSAAVRFDELTGACRQLQGLAVDNAMHIIVGMITREDDKYYNSAVVFTPRHEKWIYQKRALWGWDKTNFSIGNHSGVFDIEGLRVGLRICYEIRFPEFFRELYQEHTDLNIILFYDVSDCDDMERYEMIRGHIRTRAVENVTCTLSVNAFSPYQTAPTALYDRSGYALSELERNKENLLIYDLENKKPDFGEQGRKEISDWLQKRDGMP